MIEKQYTLWGIIYCGLLLWVPSVILLLFISLLTPKDTTLVYVGTFVFVAFGLYILFKNMRHGSEIKKRPPLLQRIASRHGYDFHSSGFEDIRSRNFKQILQRDVRLSNGLSGKDWQYGELNYAIYRRFRYSDVKAEYVYYSILKIDLGRNLPNMLFDNKKSHGRQYKWNIDTKQIASLEGNFDDYFTTYFPEHYHIDARSIITPEVMAAMIDMSPADFEICGNKLYIYSALLPTLSINDYIKAGKNLRKVLIDHAALYVDQLSPNGTSKDISVYGARLRERVRFPWTVFGISCVYALMAVDTDRFGKNIVYTLLLCGIFFATNYFAIKYWWKKRTKQKRFMKRASTAAARQRRIMMTNHQASP